MAKHTGKHMAGNSSYREEPLRDNYTYEQTSRREFEDVSSYSSARRKTADQRELERQLNPQKKKHTALKVVIAIVVVLAAAVGAGIFYIKGYLLKDLTVKPITKNKEELGINAELVVNNDTSIKNIALLGLDERYTHSSDVRSDVVMIVTVDNKHGKIKMTSVLRDSNVSIRMISENGDDYYFDDKITHTYFYGGPELAIQTLNRNFYLNIEDYVTVNFTQVAQIVNAVGGVDITLSSAEIRQLNQNLWNLSAEVAEQREQDEYNGVEHYYPYIIQEDFFRNIYGEINLYSSDDEYEGGTFHLNGNQAVAYARIRYLEGGDNVRASRQQNVIKALLNQVRGKSRLEYPEMVRQIMPLCTTSLEFDDIISMIPILLTDFTIETMSVPDEQDNADSGFNGQGGWVYLYDLEQAAREINDFIYEGDTPASINVDDDVIRVSEIYRSGNYTSAAAEDYPDDDNWEPPADLPSYIQEPPVEDDPSSEPEGGESSGGENDPNSSSGEGDDPNGGEGPGEEEPSDDPGTWEGPGGGEDEPSGWEEESPYEGEEETWADLDGSGNVTE